VSALDPGPAFVVQVAELDGGTAGLPAGEFPLTETGAGTWRQEVTLPWADPRLWDVEAAYLYRVTVGLEDGGGGSLATYPPIRFGFREVWREGKDLILNGHLLKLRQAPFVASLPAMHFFTGMGMNTIQFQPNPGAWTTFPGPANPAQAGTLELFDAADERGWLIMMPTVNVNAIKVQIARGDEGVTEAWLAQVRAASKQWDRQNRPSIICWMPAMNEVNNADHPLYTIDPDTLGRSLPASSTPPWVTEVERLLKVEDPTRLVVYHECGSTSDMHFGNVYLNLLPLQEREDLLSRWADDGDLPFGSAELGPPTTAPMFKHRLDRNATTEGIPYFTEFFAEYLGDAAYTQETDVFIDDVAATAADPRPDPRAWGDSFQRNRGCDHLGDATAYYDYIDPFIRNTNKSWRAWGANAGWHPWIQDVGFGENPEARFAENRWIEWGYDALEGGEELAERPSWANRVYDAYRETMQPLQVFLAGPPDHFTAKDHHYRSAETAQRTIVAVWDGPGRASFAAEWKLLSATTVLVSGRERFDLDPGTVERRPISVELPIVRAATDLRLVLEAERVS
jgi:beta-galactosidase